MKLYFLLSKPWWQVTQEQNMQHFSKLLLKKGNRTSLISFFIKLCVCIYAQIFTWNVPYFSKYYYQFMPFIEKRISFCIRFQSKLFYLAIFENLLAIYHHKNQDTLNSEAKASASISWRLEKLSPTSQCFSFDQSLTISTPWWAI